MKLVLNMAIEPFFCALFDEQNILEKKISWKEAKKGSSLIWDFLQENNITEQNISFIGGVSGPGGFSNLRVAGTILNTLSLDFAIPLHQVRADFIISEMMRLKKSENNDLNQDKIVLNSFGKGVFFVKEEKFERKILSDCSEIELAQKVCISFLPEPKKEYFKNGFEVDLKDFEDISLKVLEAQIPQKTFYPDYECPPVQK